MIDCIYVIALEQTLSNKREEIIERVKKIGIKSLQLVLFKAVNGFDPRVDFEWSTFPWKLEGSDNHWWNRDIKAGEVGCALSHLSVWKHAARQGYEKILILEEDFDPLKPITSDLLIEADQSDWHLCYAGRNKVKPDLEEVSENISIPDYTYCTHSYFLSKTGIKNLLDYGFENKIMPVDEFLSATFCTHPRNDLNFIWKDVRAVAFKEDYIIQSSASSVSSTENLEKVVAPPSLIKQTRDWDQWKSRYLNPAMLAQDYDLLVEEPVADVAHFPIFNKDFCDDLIQEAEKCGEWTEKRHEYYPTHDMLLSTLGFDEIYKRVLTEYVFPLGSHYYKLDGKRWLELNSENFIIKYSMDKQGFLSLHHDQSVLSSVLTLNEDFEGGGTFFFRQQKTIIGKTGEMSLHPGMVSHRHGAKPISSGVRYVLVSFLSLP
jgi:GR25 family glycosyltransferase involved in LPS biosynthesis